MDFDPKEINIEKTYKLIENSLIILQVTVACRDQLCLNRWVVIVFAKIPTYHAWKRFRKKPDDKQVHPYLHQAIFIAILKKNF